MQRNGTTARFGYLVGPWSKLGPLQVITFCLNIHAFFPSLCCLTCCRSCRDGTLAQTSASLCARQLLGELDFLILIVFVANNCLLLVQTDLLRMLDTNDNVHRYAWFTVRLRSLRHLFFFAFFTL